MNCFEIVLFVFLSAFVPSLTTVGATDYEIPEACRTNTIFSLNGTKMAGSTFIYRNYQNHVVIFVVTLDWSNNPDATVSVHTDLGTTVYKKSFYFKLDRKPVSFTLTGDWSGTDVGAVLYYSESDNYQDCYHRAATNLLVRAVYDVAHMKDKQLTIWAPENCGVQVTLGGVSKTSPKLCATTLEFDTGEKIDARSVGNKVTTANRSISFRIISKCPSTNVLLYYREKCPWTNVI